MARLIAAIMTVSACGGAATEVTAPATTVAPPTIPTPSATSSGDATLSPLASLTRPLGSAVYDPDTAVPITVAPVSITIETISVNAAPVVGVGVLPSGEMDIPGGAEVGWYRFGPTPGESGSAVLAAHIAYDGRDGVFRHLARLEPGERFEVGYADGSSRVFEVTAQATYAKEELPFDRVFAKTGGPMVVLITCGGDFNRSLGSYEDNVVVYAKPAESG